MPTHIAYGERPITELFVLLSGESGLTDLVHKIELLEGPNTVLDPSTINEVILEAPLGKRYGCVDIFMAGGQYSILCEVKPDSFMRVQSRLARQIPRYHEAIRSSVSSSRSQLVQRVFNIISSRDTYLISATDDPSFPDGLKNMYRSLSGVNPKRVGWVSYSCISDALNNFGYEIMGTSPHIWALPKQGGLNK